MKDYYDNSWMESNRWGEWGEEDEVGVMNDLTPELVLKAVQYIKKDRKSVV